MAFKTAARLAYRKGLADAGPVLLEPIYHVKIQAPDKYTGAVIGDMNRRRGRVMGMNPMEDNWQEIEAEVPLGEICTSARHGPCAPDPRPRDLQHGLRALRGGARARGCQDHQKRQDHRGRGGLPPPAANLSPTKVCVQWGRGSGPIFSDKEGVP